MTIFKKIINKEISAKVVYEDDLCLAFHDINPQAPIHVLIIPKKEIRSMNDINTTEDKDILGHLMVKAHEIAKKLDIGETGYRLVANTNKNGGQSVDHLHFHILGGRALSWPPG